MAVTALSLGSAAESAPERVLRPEAATAVQSALRAAGAAWHLQSATLGKSTATVRVCASAPLPSQCGQVRLSDPRKPCQGQKEGSFCIDGDEVGMSPSWAPLRQQLAALPDQQIWFVPAQSSAKAQPDSPSLLAFPRTTALLWVLLPFGLGGLLGAGARKWRGRAWQTGWAAAVVVVVPLLLALAWDSGELRLGVWDAAGLSLLLSAGALAAGHAGWQGRWAQRASVAGLATAMAALGFEIGLRLFAAPPPSFPPPEQAQLLLPTDGLARVYARYGATPWDERACRMMYPRADATVLQERVTEAGTAPRKVVHLGDSMTYGLGVSKSDRFTSLLQSQSPGTAHINLGVPGTSVDAALLIGRQALGAIKPQMVVLHVFLGNDLEEIDRYYPCCERGPLLNYSGQDSVALRCTEPQWQGRSALQADWLLANSPPPYPLRVATADSVLARWVAGAWVAATERLAGAPEGDDAQAWRHLEMTVAALQRDVAANGARLAVSILPPRSALVGPGPRRDDALAKRDRLAKMLKQMQLPYFDAFGALQQAAERSGAAALFAKDVADDIHFSAQGHAVVAEGLRPLVADHAQSTKADAGDSKPAAAVP